MLAAVSRQDVCASFAGPPHAFVDVGSSRLAYRRFGHGPDLVFVHGWPLHSGTFRALVPLLADAFTCHLLDLPGAGQTECRDEAAIDMTTHAGTLRAALAALELRRYGFVAQDSGGAIARLVAAGDAGTAALVLGDTEIPGHHPALITFLCAMARVPGGAGLLVQAMRCRALRRSALGFGGCFADPRALEGEFHELFLAPLFRSRGARRSQLRALRSYDPRATDGLAHAHARITAPTLLIWGDADPIFPLAKARAMLPQFRGGAALEVLAGGKTFVHEERPEDFARHARPFLLRALAG